MAKGGSPYEPRVYAGTACAPNEDSPQIEHCAIAGSDAESDTTTECSSELEGIYASTIAPNGMATRPRCQRSS